jgi:hypothetical protein
MSHTIEINNTLLEMLLKTDKEVNADAPILLSLYQCLKDFGSMMAISEVRFLQDVGDPNLYTMHVELKSGVILNASLVFAAEDDLDPMVTMSLPTPWPLSLMTFAVHHFTEVLVNLRASFGLESFTVVFA